MLLGSFYKIIDSANEGENLSATVQFDSSHPIFTGHFPTLPVVPGVCQTQMLNELLNYILGKEFSMKRASQIKFLALLNPVKTTQIQIDIKLTPELDGSFLVNANYYWQDIAYFRFKGEFQ
jgi:3-hydroxyacyl-[acyl-carrier-protein] dehydratase